MIAPDNAPNSPNPDDVKILKRLPALLLREGYVDAYTVFGTMHTHFQRVQEQLSSLPEPVRSLMSLFFLGQALPEAAVAAIFSREEIAALRRLGILLEDERGIHTGGFMAVPITGLVMLVPTPHVNQSVYFGEDSAALACRLTPRAGARCVDFCCGPGIQALRVAPVASRVVGVEINPVALGCAELNVAMNSLEDKIELRLGDLHNALEPGEQFDFLSANPPLLPFVPGLAYPFVGHGGADGLAVTRRILDSLPAVLAPGGTAQIIGTCLGDLDGPAPREELARWASEQSMQVVMTVPSRMSLRRGDPMFEGLTWTCAAATGMKADEVGARFERHLVGMKADQLYTFFLTITRESPHSGFVMTEHFRRAGGFWFR